ncbi:hypothetical protein ACHAAC_04035 [Aeromicrobium sp. CF4.19]|uniref:hypothetical protein n=1 Tax=Aeromicrobium sp. CF4.19 TaxID=3373082 RepID=UPI003EE67ECB
MTSYGSTEIETIQAVVDRVSSYQDGAPEGTVAAELRRGLYEAGMEIDESEIDSLADAIESANGDVSAASVLG